MKWTELATKLFHAIQNGDRETEQKIYDIVEQKKAKKKQSSLRASMQSYKKHLDFNLTQLVQLLKKLKMIWKHWLMITKALLHQLTSVQHLL